MNDFMCLCVVVFLLIAVPVAIVAGLGTWADAASCHSTTRAMGKAATYGALQGCIVEIEPGRWIPLDAYQFIAVTK